MPFTLDPYCIGTIAGTIHVGWSGLTLSPQVVGLAYPPAATGKGGILGVPTTSKAVGQKVTLHMCDIIGGNYDDTSEVPKGTDISYLCTKCGGSIPSIPADNVGCECGNVFIDKDYWRLVVEDFTAFQVVRKRPS